MNKRADELFQTAERVGHLRSELCESVLGEALKRLTDACNEIGKAWSGSNIGYHADTYCRGFVPTPSHAQFSAEWGLMERLSHQPDPIWEVYSDDDVRAEILARSKVQKPDDLVAAVARISAQLDELRETAVSSLTLADQSDSFLTSQLGKLRGWAPPSFADARRLYLPRGSYTSRDSTAMHQGQRLAPHQDLMAVSAFGKAIEKFAEKIEAACRASASHIERSETRTEKQQRVGTNVFIGHGRSPLWRELKDFIGDRLKLPVDEFNSVPIAGITTTARLSEMLDAAQFAFLVLTAEDEQPDGRVNARLNVIHEVGLFQGRLGFEKAIVLLEEGCEEFSNVHGLGQIRFPKGNIEAIFEKVRAVLEREDVIS